MRSRGVCEIGGDDKVVESLDLQASHKVGEEIDQPELKTDPGEELEITDYY